MKFGNEEKGKFTNSFNRQLNSSLECCIQETTFKFSFCLPCNCRFPYIDKTFLIDELLDTFRAFFPFGVKLLYLVPNSNDDHYIEVGILAKVLHKQ